MADNPALIVRVAANLEDLKKGMLETQQQVATTTGAIGTFAAKTGALPEQVQRFTAATTTAGTATERLQASLGKFDGLLASLGLNIGSQVRGIGELAGAAGQTATEIGAIATAGLVVGAGMAGWKIGRAVADFFDLDTTIGNATAKLLGWGDAAAEAAGSKADALARASKLIGFEVLSLTTAMEINAGAHGKWQSNVEISAAKTAGWHAEIAKVTAAGDLPSLTADLESQNFSLKELAQRYGVSIEALQVFGRETTKAAAAEKAASDSIQASNKLKLEHLKSEMDATKGWRDSMEELNSAGRGWQGTLDTMDGKVVEGIKFYLQAGVSQKALAEAYGVTDAQVKAVASSLRDDADATKAAHDETDRLTKSALEASTALEHQQEAAAKLKKETAAAAAEVEKLKAANRAMGNSTQFDLSSEEGRAKVPEGIRVWLHDGYSLAQAAQIDFLMRWGLPINANDPLFAHKGPAVPGFAGGVENAPGGWAMVGERGPEPMYVPPGSTIRPHGTPIGGGETHIHVHVTTPLASASQIAAAVDASLMKRMRDTGVRY